MTHEFNLKHLSIIERHLLSAVEKLERSNDKLTSRIIDLEELLEKSSLLPGDRSTLLSATEKFVCIPDYLVNTNNLDIQPQQRIVLAALKGVDDYKTLAFLLGQRETSMHSIIRKLRVKKLVKDFNPVNLKKTKHFTNVPYVLFSQFRLTLYPAVIYCKMLTLKGADDIFTDKSFLKKVLPTLTNNQFTTAYNTLTEKGLIEKVGQNRSRVRVVDFNTL